MVAIALGKSNDLKFQEGAEQIKPCCERRTASKDGVADQQVWTRRN